MIDFLKKPTIDNETKDMDDEEKEEAKEEEEKKEEEEDSIKTPIKSTYTLTTSSKTLREKQATKDENRRLVTINAGTGIEFFNE